MFRSTSLYRLHIRHLSELMLMRLGRTYAIGIAFSFALLVLVVPGQGREFVVERSASQVLVSASWVVAGLSALAGARTLGHARRTLVSGFALAHGATPRDDYTARLLTLATRIALGVFLPLLVIVGVAWASGAAGVAWGAVWLVFGLVYAPALGALLSLLAAGCARVSPSNARSLLVTVVVLPELLRQAGADAAVTLPRLCGWAIAQGESWARAVA